MRQRREDNFVSASGKEREDSSRRALHSRGGGGRKKREYPILVRLIGGRREGNMRSSFGPGSVKKKRKSAPALSFA